jgi:hypothetical protein
MPGIGRFETFISDLIRHHDALARQLPAHRSYVIASARVALGQLRAARPADEGEEILLESAIELFEELIERASAGS